MEYLKILKPTYLTEEFLSPYVDLKPNFGPIGLIVFLRTYSRFIELLNRREFWWETCARVTEYSISLIPDNSREPFSFEYKKQQAELLFDNLFKMNIFASGRTMFTGGTKFSSHNGTANFNCAFLQVDCLKAFSDTLYLLMNGAGVGYSIENRYVSNLPTFNTGINVLWDKESKYKGKKKHLENTVSTVENNVAFIKVGDSKLGWSEALLCFLEFYTKKNIEFIFIDFSYIRPEGTRLKVFGGRASGPEPLKKMFAEIDFIIKNKEGRLNSVAAMDIMNSIAKAIIVGGVRRSAQIALGDIFDKEFVEAKVDLFKPLSLEDANKLINDIWPPVDTTILTDDINNNTKDYLKLLSVTDYRFLEKLTSLAEQAGNLEEVMGHIDKYDPKFRYRSTRVLSNNSVMAWEKPETIEDLKTLFEPIKNIGDPGIIFAGNAAKRRPRFKGVNPCAEILLTAETGAGSTCNLTEVNTVNFVKEREYYIGDEIKVVKYFDIEGAKQAIALAVEMGSRITLTKMWDPDWDFIQKRDRLLGVSLTGIVETFNLLGISATDPLARDILSSLKEHCLEVSNSYHDRLGIPRSLIVTTGKPSGTVSLLPGVSSGVHAPYAPYYIRRIRISKIDPLAKALQSLGLVPIPENGQGTDINAENCNTWIFSFPIKSETNIRAIDESAIDQLERYKVLMGVYVQHNQSITVTVAPEEWDEVIDWVWNNWDYCVGIAFLPRWDPQSGGSHPNLPLEPITEEEYNNLSKDIVNISEQDLIETITKFESAFEEYELESSCETGLCPVR